MPIEVDPDWWKTLFDDVYLLTDAPPSLSFTATVPRVRCSI